MEGSKTYKDKWSQVIMEESWVSTVSQSVVRFEDRLIICVVVSEMNLFGSSRRSEYVKELMEFVLGCFELRREDLLIDSTTGASWDANISASLTSSDVC